MYSATSTQISEFRQHERKQTHPFADEQVLGLDVSVDHVLGVAVVQGDRQVMNVSASERERG
jgi:hypothetical protein